MKISYDETKSNIERRYGERRRKMEILLGIAAFVAIVGGLILWGCHAYVPIGDPGTVRIILRNGEATGRVAKPEVMFLWAKGWLTTFVEAPRRFDVEVAEFKFVLPNDEILSTSLTLLFEVVDGGGDKFVKNGQKDGVSVKSTRIARTAIERFAQNKNEEPTTADAAQKMQKEFILRVVDALVKDDLLGEANGATDREAYLDDLVIKLAENDGEHPVTQFGLKLVGLNMAQFVEPKMVTDAAAERKAAEIKNLQKKDEIVALKERVNILSEGHNDVSFKDATMAVQIAEGTIQHKINEEIIRVVDDGSGGGIGTLIAGARAIFGTNKSNNSSGGGKNGKS